MWGHMQQLMTGLYELGNRQTELYCKALRNRTRFPVMVRRNKKPRLNE